MLTFAVLRASKVDGPVCGRFILRGSLRSHLRMTANDKHASAFSRRDTPEVFQNHSPQNTRAQGRPRALCTRGLACNCASRTRTRAYRFSGNTPAFPAQSLYGLLRALLC